jgi:hypothetical protein
MKKSVYNGLCAPDNGLNTACERAHERCINNPDLAIIWDSKPGGVK